MRFDFWNNPLVVSAMRIRYRRGGLVGMMISYFLVLVTGSVAMFYYRDRIAGPFPRNILLAIVTIQCLISFALAAAATSQSMRLEVTNRTLDFQRIAALSPLRIYLGKLIGEPLGAFFSIIPTIPVTVYVCLILGVEGMNLFNLLLVYANIITTTVLSAATGLLQPLEPDPQGKPKQSANIGSIIFGLFFCFVPVLISGSMKIVATPWAAALLGMVTPVPTILGIYQGDPWEIRMHFFDLRIPFILVTSISQLALTCLIIHGMIRRMVNPLRIAISRRLAYLLLIIVDLLVAGVFFEVPPFGLGFYARSAAFWIVHIFISHFLVTLVTPGRETLWNWLWRFRGKTGIVNDLAVGERSVNTLAVVIFACIGVIDFFGMVVAPARLHFTPEEMSAFIPNATRMALLCFVLTCMYGSLYQWIVIAFNRTGRGFFISIVLLLILPADLIGRYYHIEQLVSLTPVCHFEASFKDRPSTNYAPVVIAYAIMALVALYWTYRRQTAMGRVVVNKLRKMDIDMVAPVGAVVT
jgi:hypothetical protein